MAASSSTSAEAQWRAEFTWAEWMEHGRNLHISMASSTQSTTVARLDDAATGEELAATREETPKQKTLAGFFTKRAPQAPAEPARATAVPATASAGATVVPTTVSNTG